MTFEQLLKEKNITGYALSKNTGIAYSTIHDLISGKIVIQNISLKHAIKICEYIKIDINKLIELESIHAIGFRYFRNNILHTLKTSNSLEFVENVIKNRKIDFYYKNQLIKEALYLLALIDYLCRINGKEIYTERYNNYRKAKLETPYFVGSELISFDSIEEAEQKLNIKVIPEFARFNIIEEDVFNVV